MSPVLAPSQDPIGDWFTDNFSWVGDVFTALGPYWIWILVFFIAGGGTLAIAPFRWMYRQFPGPRKRQQERLEAKRLKEIERAEKDAKHAETCRCGEDCEGRKSCEEHHPDCNCEHISFCVCQDEKNCDCECRCDCRECDGYKLRGPLVRIPHSSPVSTVARGTAGKRQEEKKTGPASAGKNSSWAKARDAFLQMSEQYAAYECDPFELARIPALTDVTFGPTATFVETFYQANQLLTTTKPTEPGAAGRFITAAELAINAWQAANKAAEVIRDTRYGSDDKLALRRIRASLKLAENADKPEERRQAQDTAARLMRELAERTEKVGTWRLPEKARLELETWTRRGLTTGPHTDDRATN